jgi:DNA-binding transcriptional ArsR family regulator
MPGRSHRGGGVRSGWLTGWRWVSTIGGAAVSRPLYQLKAEFFKTLGHPARIRILEVLREGEHTVGEMVPRVGIEASHLSHQLAVLRRNNIVQTRKLGATVLYTVVDPRMFQLLEVTKQILTGSLLATQELLADLELLRFEDETL